MSDPLLDAFADAWRSLRSVVERLEATTGGDRDGTREELVTAVERVVETRAKAREGLAAQHGERVADQVLNVRELEVGAVSRELDGFIERWPSGGGGLLVDEILEWIRPLLVEPGSPEAHQA